MPSTLAVCHYLFFIYLLDPYGGTEGVRRTIGDMKDEHYLPVLNEGLGAASKVTGYPYEPAARLKYPVLIVTVVLSFRSGGIRLSKLPFTADHVARNS